MANNIITVINFTENEQYVTITPTTSGSAMVASGMLQPGQTSGFVVEPGNALFNVYFQPQATSGLLTATNIAPNSQVGVSITGGNQEGSGQVEAKKG